MSVEGVEDQSKDRRIAEMPLRAEPPPLRVDEGGAVRVGRSRVALDLVVGQYENGMAPEEMVRAYDTLELADVHGAIAYYLRHRDEVRAFLSRRAEEAAALRTKIEADRPSVSREELIARRRAQDALREGTPDPEVLAWAAAGEPAPGLIVATGEQSVGSAIDDILLIAEFMAEEEISSQVVVFLPLRQ